MDERALAEARDVAGLQAVAGYALAEAVTAMRDESRLLRGPVSTETTQTRRELRDVADAWTDIARTACVMVGTELTRRDKESTS